MHPENVCGLGNRECREGSRSCHGRSIKNQLMAEKVKERLPFRLSLKSRQRHLEIAGKSAKRLGEEDGKAVEATTAAVVAQV